MSIPATFGIKSRAEIKHMTNRVDGITKNSGGGTFGRERDKIFQEHTVLSVKIRTL